MGKVQPIGSIADNLSRKVNSCRVAAALAMLAAPGQSGYAHPMKSMTGYAALEAPGRRWDIRAVNGRGLDLRVRAPDQPPGIEPLLREKLTKRVARGNVTVSLRLGGDEGEATPHLNPEGLDRVLEALTLVQEAATARGLNLAPTRASDVLGLRGVWEMRDAQQDLTLEMLGADMDELLTAFEETRASEGARLKQILSDQVLQIEGLTTEAEALAPVRAAHMEGVYRAALDRLGAEMEEPRVVQEVAVLAVKGDVTEELDRLRAHIHAARDLLAADGPVGRRFDFLTQEFNREANTLCSKAQMTELTRIGLALKTVIDRLREQVQNVE